MGDIADGLIDGTFDSFTGEYLGEGPGYPRSRHWGKPKKKKKKTPPLSNPEINRINVWKLLFTENYKGDFQLEEVAFEYCTKELKLQTNIKKATMYKHILLDGERFKNWFKEKYTPKNGIES